MNVLVIGQNGREHALAETYAKSKNVKKVVMTPGNGLTDFTNKKIKNYPEVSMWDFEKIVEVCEKEKIDLVDVAQDDIIAAGYVDRFEQLGIKAFGANKLASQLEWDKEWSRNFMEKYNLPIPRYKSFSNEKEAVKYVNSLETQVLYIKATGLVGGKGAIRAEDKKQAVEAIKDMKQFKDAGKTFLIEETLIGEEFSLFAMCDGKNFQIIGWAQDHKTLLDKDLGPNTGGMGSVAPTKAINKKDIKEVEIKILKPLLLGMQKEGRPYKGILYVGGMKTKKGIKIIEFNCRYGDPEAEVILPSIKNDYLKIIEETLKNKLPKIKLDNMVRISIAGCAKGYPIDTSKVKGKKIFGLENALKLKDITIFGSGIKREGKIFVANGGRLFYIVSEGKNILDAREKAYKAMSLISIEGDNLHYRTDIGWRDLQR